MRRFSCRCGSRVFFHSRRCLACETDLGFDPQSLTVLSMEAADHKRYLGADGRYYRYCDNGEHYGVCNWLVPEGENHPLCFACRFNRTVPNQELPGNRQRWEKLEEGKKRLFYSLLQLGLPLVDGWRDPENGLLIDFIEDQRSQPEVFAETFVTTGYLGGIITINALEADDPLREAVRYQMNESYRTIVGHLRHEAGHYFWARVQADDELQEQFRALYGDEGINYQQALENYHASGPSAGWQKKYISAYASAHPMEDWAESWAHYLHIHDALDTAAADGLVAPGPGNQSMAERVVNWQRLSVSLNEVNRSLGVGDAYPFVITPAVEDKLAFVDRVVRRIAAPG